MTTPTIGAHVIYHASTHQAEAYKAVITGIHANDLVDLCVSDAAGVFTKLGVPLVEDEDANHPPYAMWPKTEAAKEKHPPPLKTKTPRVRKAKKK